MLRTVGLILAVAILGGAIAVAATLIIDRDKAEAPEPDRVIGLVKRCSTFSEKGQRSDLEGEADCSDRLGGFRRPVNVHLELTIRTQNGTTYTVNVEPSAVVKVGDPWPGPCNVMVAC